MFSSLCVIVQPQNTCRPFSEKKGRKRASCSFVNRSRSTATLSKELVPGRSSSSRDVSIYSPHCLVVADVLFFPSHLLNKFSFKKKKNRPHCSFFFLAGPEFVLVACARALALHGVLIFLSVRLKPTLSFHSFLLDTRRLHNSKHLGRRKKVDGFADASSSSSYLFLSPFLFLSDGHIIIVLFFHAPLNSSSDDFWRCFRFFLSFSYFGSWPFATSAFALLLFSLLFSRK